MALNEPLHCPVVCAFHLGREYAPGQFPHAPVISDALTAHPLAAARLISTTAALDIIWFITFHTNHIIKNNIRYLYIQYGGI